MLSRIAERRLPNRLCVSYSHSKGYGAAAVGDEPVGIDVEVVRELSPGTAHLFLAVDEEAAAARCGLAHALLHFWSAKEARWKQLGGTVPTLKRVPIRVVRVREDGIDFDCVETVRVGEVVVALAGVTRPTS